MENLDLVFYDNTCKYEWDRYVTSSAGASYAHLSSWKEIIEETYGHKSYYLLAFCNKKVVGVLPLFLISIPFLGKVLASGVFASYGGICSNDIKIASFLMNKASLLAQSLKVKYLEIKNIDGFNVNNKKWVKYSNYCTMVLELDSDPSLTWNKLRRKTRADIRKAESLNIKIVNGNEYIDTFYKLVVFNMRQLGTPVHSKKFYQSILEKYKDSADIFIAELTGRPIAASLSIKFNNTIFGVTGVMDYNYLKYKPNQLIYWKIIESLAGSTIRYYDFGRSILNSGTYNFKKNFGADSISLHYDYYLNKIKSIPAINQENKKMKLATNLWSHLPLSVTKMLGPHLIKYVA